MLLGWRGDYVQGQEKSGHCPPDFICGAAGKAAQAVLSDPAARLPIMASTLHGPAPAKTK
jgi:hypothetical protein